MMWPKLRDFFARELLTLIDPTQPKHRRRKVQIVATVGLNLPRQNGRQEAIL
ncbi:hypothetical protein [Pandoraea apista]|uniref:hypothetical protein n=1 Tax=Pandoraea apista TaxID=93218 RepID=UPI002F9538CD